MLTRRDLIVAFIVACGTLGLVALTRAETPIMHSKVFEWNSIQVEPKQHGATRRFFQDRENILNTTRGISHRVYLLKGFATII